MARLLGLAHGDSGRGDLGAGENRLESIGESGEGLRILRSSTCGSSSSSLQSSCCPGNRSGDWLLDGVWAGDGDTLCGDDCPDSYISMLEQDGSDSSWNPERSEVSRTEYLAPVAGFESSRHLVGLSRSMEWTTRRCCRTARRLGDTPPHSLQLRSPELEDGEMCSFWKCAFMAICRWNRFLHAGHTNGRGLVLSFLCLTDGARTGGLVPLSPVFCRSCWSRDE